MKKLRAVDLFCGAGGSTTGAIAAGLDVVLAVNHWRTAIYSHQKNHPNVRHICARIEQVDARNDQTLPDFDVLMASPECTHHSIARGGKPVSDQSRQQPFALLDWIDAKRPRWVVVENVREFLDWGPVRNVGSERVPVWQPDKARKGETFRGWVNAIQSLGYGVEWSILNAADYREATKRNRLFVIAKRGGGEISFPNPTHAGKWRAAAEVIDWSRPCPSIFSRKRPLADKTLRRIEIGLRKFVGEAAEPFIVRLRASRASVGMGGTVHSSGDPLGTVTAGGSHHALAVPYLVNAKGQSTAMGVDEPCPTLTANAKHVSLAVPFLSQFHNGPDGERRTYSVDDPLPTLDTQPRYALTVPYLIDIHNRRRDDTATSVDDPTPTIVTKPGNSLVMPFLTHYYGTGGANTVDEPLATVTAKHRFGLAMASLLQTMRELSVVDIGFRMLDADELAAAMGFPVGYYLHGNKADQIRQVGNAVCPGVMRAICEEIAA